MIVRIIAFTGKGCALGEKLADLLAPDDASCASATGEEKVSLSGWTADCFQSADTLVFIGATGIAVRAIAPHLKSKTTDPAVLVVDDLGRFCISLVSGHLGGANELARRVAALLGATPVITTATDGAGVFAVDTWAKSQGLRIRNPEAIKLVSGKLLAGQTVRLKSDFPVTGRLPDGVALVTEKPFDMAITIKQGGAAGTLYLVPPVAYLGVGCRKNITREALDEAYDKLLAKGSLDPAAVCGAASIDLKREEAGLLEFCKSRGLPFTVYKPGTLNRAAGNFTASAFVQKTTGTDNVCERSSVVASQGGRLILKKNAGNGVTMAMALKDYTVKFEECV